MLRKIFSITLLLNLCLVSLPKNSFAVTEFIVTVNKTGEDFNLISTAEDTLDDAGDITASDCKVFTVNTVTADFVPGETVTGGTSGATGTVIWQTATQILIDGISGTFQAENLTGSVAGDVDIDNDGDSVQITIECYDDDGELQDNVTFNGLTTDSTHYWNLTAPSGERHNGTISQGFLITKTHLQYTSLIVNSDDYTRISWVIADVKDNWGAGGIISNSTSTIFNCIALNASNNASISGFRLESGPGVTFTIYNCLSYNNGYSGFLFSTSSNVNAYNLTAVDNPIGFYGYNGSHIYKNCLANGNTTDYNTTANSSSTNNLAEDETTPEYNTYYDSKTVTFVNEGSDDFHLDSTDTVAINKGVDLSATFTDDIDGITRTGTWDIGADQYVGGAEPPATNNSRIIFISKLWLEALKVSI